jgi:hypothetical protein
MAVDESMVPFKGRSSIKQYLPMKHVKRGYKIWCLADSKTGFINHFEVYAGKKDTRFIVQFGRKCFAPAY